MRRSLIVKIHTSAFAMPLACGIALSPGPAKAVNIIPNFDASITGNSNSSLIEGAINRAIDTIGSLYSNAVNLSVNFTYNTASAGNLLSTRQSYYKTSYSNYVGALTSISNANPSNTTLGTALRHLSQGNNAAGNSDMVMSSGQAVTLGLLLSVPSGYNPVININSSQDFSFSATTPSSRYDLTGGLLHELDEVLGGGGAGSNLGRSCNAPPYNFFCGAYGGLDLYRYSAANTPSYSTSAGSSYFSIDGGATSVVAFNQNGGGDYADFGPPGTGPGQLIQNAFNSTGQDEAYTTASPEFTMMQALGYNGFAAVPLPASLPLIASGFGLLGFAARRKKRGQKTPSTPRGHA